MSSGCAGTHVGCEHGVCGCCTVLLDGRSARSCLLLAAQCEGATVTTIEGLSPADGGLGPIQQAFRESHALQCGFCTPGFVVTVTEFLEENAGRTDFTDEEIREGLSGNLCRCTGYQNIVAAVRRAAELMAKGGLTMATQTFGERITRNEDPRFLRGEGRYLDDVEAVGALHVAFLRSPMAHARISGLDVSRARAHPGVERVYTCDDIGELDQPLPLLIPHPAMTHPRTQRPLARDEVAYAGQVIAAVVAVDRYVAEDAVELIDVDYEPLPVIVDLEAAAAEGAPLVHDDVPGNLACRLLQTHGDPDAAFAEAEVTVSETFTIERSAGMPLEARGVLAFYDTRAGELTVYDSTQAPISIRGGLASLFGIPEDKVRVIAPDTGGGFGTKVMMFYPEEVLVPFAAVDIGRPVKWVEDRTEHFIGSNHERMQIHRIELAARRDGTVIGLRDSFLHDTGAFIPYGIAVAQVAAAQIAGPYRIDNIGVELQAIYTNTVPVSPYRGCGRPQACLTIELAMDKLAAELGIDRMELRRRNFIQPEDFPYGREGLIFADGKPVVMDSGDYPGGLDDVLAGTRLQGVPGGAGRGAEAGPSPRARARVLHRGHRARAVRGRAGPGAPDRRQGVRHHRPDHAGPGARDDVRPDRRRPAGCEPVGRRADHGRHRRLSIRRGDVREPRGGGQRHRHPPRRRGGARARRGARGQHARGSARGSGAGGRRGARQGLPRAMP